MPATPGANALAPGRMVALHGLVKRPDLNGAVGRVAVAEDPSSARPWRPPGDARCSSAVEGASPPSRRP